MTYANYAYYQNIARVKMGLKEISQSINEARNLALAWYQRNGINQSIGVFFDTKNPNQIKFFNYHYNSGVILDDAYLFKTKNLQQYVGINGISGQENLMIYFSSIYAQPELYYFTSNIKNTYSTWEVNFTISFKDSPNFPLKRELKYIKKTNVVDY